MAPDHMLAFLLVAELLLAQGCPLELLLLELERWPADYRPTAAA
jgi:hypothetical protein